MTFERPTLIELRDAANAEIAAGLGGVPLPTRGNLPGILANALAGMIHGNHGHLADNARQILPDTASSLVLERHAAWRNIIRKAASFALGKVEFSAVIGSQITAGDTMNRQDGASFIVQSTVVATTTLLTVDVVAELAGEAGNTSAGAEMVLASPVSGVDTQGAVESQGIGSGAEPQSDESLRAQLQQATAFPASSVGAPGDYVRNCLDVPGVTRAFALKAFGGLGKVGLTFTTDDDPAGPIPNASKVVEVRAYMEDFTAAGAILNVFAPIEKALNPQIQLTPDNGETRAAVEASLEALLRDEAEPGGTILATHLGEAISTAPGETDHDLQSPVGDVTSLPGELITLGTITWL